MGNVLPLGELTAALDHERQKGKSIVTTNGAFDLLHDGHKFLFSEARKHGDLLVVGVNSDASVKRYKGESRPIEPENKRASKVAKFADYVFIFDGDDPRPWLPHIKPNVHVNSATYGPECVEASILRELGAKLILLPFRPELGSTTERLKSS